MVRKIFVALWAMLACTAYASEVAYTFNKAGGVITLTSTQCHHKHMPNTWVVHSTIAGTNRTNLGCWVLVSGRVFIRWDGDPQMYSYPAEGFILFKKGERM